MKFIRLYLLSADMRNRCPSLDCLDVETKRRIANQNPEKILTNTFSTSQSCNPLHQQTGQLVRTDSHPILSYF